MKKFIIYLFSIFLIITIYSSKVHASTIEPYELGKVNFAVTNVSEDINRLTDKNFATSVTIRSGSRITHTFTNPVNVIGYYLYVSGTDNTKSIRLNFYDSNNQLLGTGYTSPPPSTFIASYTPMTLTNIKRIEIVHDGSIYARPLAEFNLLIADIDITPPEVPKNITYTPTINAVNLSWEANKEVDLQGYNIYVNGVKHNQEVVNTNSYYLDGLIGGAYSSVQLTSIDVFGNESAKSSVTFVTPYAEPKVPTLKLVNTTDTTINLEWDKVANDFEVYLNDELVKKQSNTTISITKLTPLTDYKVHIIAIDQFKRRIESNVLNVKTKALIISKPNFTISNITDTSFQITMPKDIAVKSYDIYLNDSLVINQTSNSYTFTNLQQTTKYTVKVVAKNDEMQEHFSLSTTTKKTAVPAVTGVKATNNTGGTSPGSTSKKIDYTTTDDVTHVDLYVDGVKVGTYEKGQPIILDNIDSTKPMVDIELKPTNGGDSYKVSVPVKTTGDADIDQITGEMTNQFGLIKKVFLYLAIGAIPLTLIVVLFFWLRKRFKPMLLSQQDNKPFDSATNNKNQKNHAKSKSFSVDATRQDKFVYQKKQKHYEKHGMQVNSVKERLIPTFTGYQKKVDITYKKDDVIYKSVYRKGQGRVYVPIDLQNQRKHVGNQIRNIKNSFSVNHKKK